MEQSPTRRYRLQQGDTCGTYVYIFVDVVILLRIFRGNYGYCIENTRGTRDDHFCNHALQNVRVADVFQGDEHICTISVDSRAHATVNVKDLEKYTRIQDAPRVYGKEISTTTVVVVQDSMVVAA